MDDYPENVLKKLCCTCLSDDRKLYRLCRITEGVNNLYWLLSYDSEAYREGFYKDTASLSVCWECRAILWRFSSFRRQACTAQKQLSSIADGRNDVKTEKTCLSQLSHHHKTAYDQTFTSEESDITDNFVDCGPVTDLIKSEDEIDDIPLSELHNNFISDDETIDNIIKDIKSPLEEIISNKVLSEKPFKKKKTKIKSKKNDPKVDNDKKYFKIEMSEKEMVKSREKRKLMKSYVKADFKCDSCIEVFKDQIDLDAHDADFHTEKPNHVQCSICLSYVETSSVEEHRTSHYVQHSRKKGERKTPKTLRPGSKPRRNQAMMDKRTPLGYLCTECDKYFDNKNQRWKHVQRHHKEGFRCHACGKRFAFKNNLTRHELMHTSPPPRVECPTCHKLIRSDLTRPHARTHLARPSHACATCDKRFVSRASYEHHLKYTQAHASTDILKYKCSACDKGYRSRGELRDHYNYQHMGRTQHKCPICGKALATRRCITRHVRRAHDGLKESARDKVCQQCGKAFRDKKGLREHEFIHTGERPLSCEICGCTFRQSASLYTHRKRVHKIYPQKREVQLLDSAAVEK